MKWGIIGIGVDIEPSARFKIDRNARLLERMFTKKEVDYCFKKRYPHMSLSATYAAKEAVYKALASSGAMQKRFNPMDIEILRRRGGAPSATINLGSHKRIKVHLTISHDQDRSIAFAIATEPKV